MMRAVAAAVIVAWLVVTLLVAVVEHVDGPCSTGPQTATCRPVPSPTVVTVRP